MKLKYIKNLKDKAVIEDIEKMSNKKNEYFLNYNFLNRENSLKIIFDVFDDEEISLLQKKAYNQFIDNIKEVFVKSYIGLKDYCNKNYNRELNETNFYKYIIPKQIYIKRESNGKKILQTCYTM